MIRVHDPMENTVHARGSAHTVPDMREDMALWDMKLEPPMGPGGFFNEI